MDNRAFDCFRQSLGDDEIAGFVDLSQFSLRPSVSIWSKKEAKRDVPSDMSSSASDGGSRISESVDSVSVVSSSDSDDSVGSIEVDSVAAGDDLGRPAELLKSHISLFGGDALNVDGRIAELEALKKKLIGIVNELQVDSGQNVHSTLPQSFQVFASAHRTVCMLASVDMAPRPPNLRGGNHVKRLMPTYKELYSGLVSFQTNACKLLSEDIAPNALATLLELVPYVTDTLLCILGFLLRHLREPETHRELVGVFERLLNYATIVCCSYVDHSNELLSKMSTLSLYRLATLCLPLELALGMNTETKGSPEDAAFRQELVEQLADEYLADDFKPSSVVLFRLRADARSGGRPDAEAALANHTAAVLKKCLRAGLAKRFFPTSTIEPIGCFNLLQCTQPEQLWNRVNFWLLQMPDNVDASVRKMALLTVRHALCTLELALKDRQQVLAHVYNALSEDDTIAEALSTLTCVSKLYPLKDGAVKRIATLTLKGSRGLSARMVLDFFPTARYTDRGLAFLLTVYRELADRAPNEPGYDSKTRVVQGLANAEEEATFVAAEWPLIVDSLVTLAQKHREIAASVPLEDDLMQYIGRRKLEPLPAAAWVSLLWSYLSGCTDERWVLFKTLWFPEARLRFPRLVKALSPDDRAAFDKYAAVIGQFVEFGTPESPDLPTEFLKDKSNWRVINELRFPHSLDHTERAALVFNDDYTLLGPAEAPMATDDACNCPDCRMDAMLVADEKGPSEPDEPSPPFDPLTDVFDDTVVCENIQADGFGQAAPSSSQPGKGPEQLGALAEGCVIDDVDCYEFPVTLGREITFAFACPQGHHPSDLAVFYTFPEVLNTTGRRGERLGGWVNPGEVAVKPVFRPSGDGTGAPCGSVTTTVNFPYATLVPFPLTFFFRSGSAEGSLGQVWVHPKRP